MNYLLYLVLPIAAIGIGVILGLMSTRRKKPSERELLEFLIGVVEESNFHLLEVLRILHHAATRVKINELGATMIDGVGVGVTRTFTATFNGALQAGTVPVWASDNTTDVTLAPAADGLSVAITGAASFASPSFNLTVTGVASDGNSVTTTVSVPLNAAVVPATSVVIDELPA